VNCAFGHPARTIATRGRSDTRLTRVRISIGLGLVIARWSGDGGPGRCRQPLRRSGPTRSPEVRHGGASHRLRCSTDQQDLTAQRDGLIGLGVAPNRIYVDHGLTGTNRERPGLREALAACRDGDTLVVTKLDRLARSLPDARAIADELTARHVSESVRELVMRGRVGGSWWRS
jgi:hypothetical protein